MMWLLVPCHSCNTGFLDWAVDASRSTLLWWSYDTFSHSTSRSWADAATGTTTKSTLSVDYNCTLSCSNVMSPLHWQALDVITIKMWNIKGNLCLKLDCLVWGSTSGYIDWLHICGNALPYWRLQSLFIFDWTTLCGKGTKGSKGCPCSSSCGIHDWGSPCTWRKDTLYGMCWSSPYLWMWGCTQL